MRHYPGARFIASAVLCLTPLLFGGVDAWVQEAGIAAMVIGYLIYVPRREAMPLLLIGALALGMGWLLVKDLMPASYGGTLIWRESLIQDYQLVLGSIRHPEQMRFWDTWLMLLAGILWFWWVRSLMDGKVARGHFCWTLLISAFVVALVSLLVKNSDPDRIFNLRYTPGYLGFGPFPNRNHTASLLAMGLMMGGGCLMEMLRHRRPAKAVFCVVMVGVIFQALLTSGSRGALAAALGGGLFFVFCFFLRHKNFKILVLLLGGMLLVGSFFFLSNSKVLGRIQQDGVGSHASEGRVEIWKDAWKVVQDAPWLGHGLDTFASIFPFYQRYGVTNHRILHPESSGLLLLSEWGLVATGIGLVILLMMVIPHLKRLPWVEHGFSYRTGAFAALVVVALHGCWDVPWHRWGIMLYVLTVLAIACPSWIHSTEKTASLLSGAFLLPLALVGIFSVLRWAPGAPHRPADVEAMTLQVQQKKAVPLREIERALRWYPLSGALHHAFGLGILPDPNLRERAWNHFRVADRLIPYSWTMPYEQAVAGTPYSVAAACHYWAMAIERSGHRRDEILGVAMNRTSKFPEAKAYWRQYVEEESYLIPAYLLQVSPSDASTLYAKWWKERSNRTDWTDGERSAFYLTVSRWGTLEQFQSWVKANESRENQEYLLWVRVYHEMKRDDLAWEILKKRLPTPVFSSSVSENLNFLRGEWEQHPENWSNAQSLTLYYHSKEAWEERNQVIFSTARREGAPVWFREVGARILGDQGDFSGAIKLLLRHR